MTRTSYFDSPFLLGLDGMRRALDRAAKSAGDGYPPYNIEQTKDGVWRLTLAVAGFAREDLSVLLDNQQLVVRGRKHDEEEREYIYRGVAARQFQRAYALADGVEVASAELENGLLTIDLVRNTIDADVRSIEIKSQGA